MNKLFNLDQLDQFDEQNKSKIQRISQNDIAIIGMAVKFPQADSLDSFWHNLINGVDSIRTLSPDRMADIKDYFDYTNKKISPDDFEQAGYLETVDRFDHSYFQISPREASLMDLNQRLFLETAISAVEDSGYGGDVLKGSNTGVYVGFGVESQYKVLVEDVVPELRSMSVAGNLNPLIASRVSYFLNLTGPSMLVDTTCSSSLVAVHLACQSIINKECEMAIVGGSQTYALPIRKTDIGIVAADNRAKTFDFYADGTGGGEGVAAIILKPLNNANRDGDHVYAVIKGSAVNNDGRSNGITAPNAIAQEKVIVKAWEKANIDPETITYIEAHGTGTKLGDPIEIDGLTKAFGRYTERKQFCGIGSVKTNIGHLDNSAGIAGLIKAVLMLKNKKIPPTLNFNRPNGQISFQKSPLYISDQLHDWLTDDTLRRCGINSFGLSGTNCHVVLEEYVQSKRIAETENRDNRILTLSAKNERVLSELIQSFLVFIAEEKDLNYGDMCFTASTGRGHYEHRLAIVFHDQNSLCERLKLIEHVALDQLALENVFYNRHKVVARAEDQQAIGEISKSKQDLLTKEISELVEKQALRQNKDLKTLVKISQAYVNGASINWLFLYQDRPYQRISIPAYPFERTRCWLEIPQTISNILHSGKDFYSVMQWKIKPIEKGNQVSTNRNVLILRTENKKIDQLVEQYHSKGHRVIEVKLGERFERFNDLCFSVGDCEEDYRKLFQQDHLDGITDIIHTSSLSADAASDHLCQLINNQRKGIQSLLYLTRAMISNQLGNQMNLTVISEGINEINTSSTMKPENAMLLGLVKGIRWEYPYINVKFIDTDEITELQNIYQEMGVYSKELEAAYRNNVRYVPILSHIQQEDLPDHSIDIRDQGVYVITGGMGRVGLEIGKYLASLAKVKLALINRSEIPESTSWDHLLETSTDEALKSKIRDLITIRNAGAIISFYRGDIADENQLETILTEIRNTQGPINGLIHCAGVGVGKEGKTIDKEKREVFEQVLRPKVVGTWLLDKATRQDNLDFFVMFSSVITMIGGVGSGCYIAANSYLDAFSDYRSSLGYKTVTINWPAWDKDDFIKSAKIDTGRQLVNIISPKEAVLAFGKILAMKYNRVIAGQLNYQGKLFEMDDYLPFNLSDEIKAKINKIKNQDINSSRLKAKETRPWKLSGKELPDYNQVEEQIAMIWKEVLGFKDLSVRDNFFEIGGDSIMIARVHTLINERLDEDVKIVDLFAYPTISKLAEYLFSKFTSLPARQGEEKEEVFDIMDLLDNLESGNVSLEDAMKSYFDGGAK